jgi:hypothetical protein
MNYISYPQIPRMLVEVTDAIDAGERSLGSSIYENHKSYWRNTIGS